MDTTLALNLDSRLIFRTMKIDFDRGKERSNRLIHGCSLESAAYLFNQLVFPEGATAPYACNRGECTGQEVRHEHLSCDEDGKVVVMVTAMSPDRSVRVTEFRKAYADEREHFEALTGYREEA